MIEIFSILLVLFISIFFIESVVLAQSDDFITLGSDGNPEISHVTVNNISIPKYEKFEISFQLSGTWSNPYDPEQVAVDGIFKTPDGKNVIMPGFFFQDYQRSFINGREILKPVGKPLWKIRFSPTVSGSYTYKIQMVNKDQTVQTEEQTFNCTDNSNKNGFLRVSEENPYYFKFDDGSPFFVVGENIATLGSMGTALADKWYTSLARVGGNFARQWWCSGGTDIESWITERPDQGLGKYKMDQAWRIDYIMDMSEKLGIAIMACIETQQYLRRDAWWDKFTYNKANGGPVESPADYFVNDVSDAYFKKRLRYMVARWSYSTALFSWQFWNEVSACNDFKPDNAARWHERMSRYLRSIDPYNHIIHSNFGNMDGYQQVDGLPETEIISTNIYSCRDMGHISAWGTRMMTSRYKKPYLLTEYGVGHRGFWVEDDPEGVIVHNGLWGALMSGSAGAGMPWGWGNWVDQQNMYHYWKVVSDVVRDIPFHKRQWKPINVEKLVYKNSSKSPYYASTFFEGWPRNYSYTTSPRPLPKTFRISPQGEVDQQESFNAEMQGGVSHTLSIDFPVDGALIVHVPEIASYGKSGDPILRVTMDGQEVINQKLIAHNDKCPWQFWMAYPVPVKSGHHDFEISNIGGSALWTGYELQNYIYRKGPDLDVIGMQTDDYILLWARNPRFIWIFEREKQEAGKIINELEDNLQDEGILTLSGISDGEYSITWWETTTGKVLSRRVENAKDNILTILTPKITRSAAAKIIKLSS
jgi:hypothetical protein